MSTRARMNLARVVLRHSHVDEQLYVKRFGAGNRYNGRWEEGEYDLLPITASVQPVSEPQVNAPEGVRTTDDLMVYCINEEPKPADRTEQRPADLLSWGGNDYEVVEMRDWSKVASYWQARVRRVRQ